MCVSYSCGEYKDEADDHFLLIRHSHFVFFEVCSGVLNVMNWWDYSDAADLLVLLGSISPKKWETGVKIFNWEARNALLSILGTPEIRNYSRKSFQGIQDWTTPYRMFMKTFWDSNWTDNNVGSSLTLASTLEIFLFQAYCFIQECTTLECWLFCTKL